MKRGILEKNHNFIGFFLFLLHSLVFKITYQGTPIPLTLCLVILLKHNSDDMFTDFTPSKIVVVFHNIVLSFFQKYSLSTFVQVAVLGIGDEAANKTDKAFNPGGVYILLGEQTVNK